MIYFYTRNTFPLSFWSSKQFDFSQCTSLYIKGNQFGKTADEINDHLIRSIVEIKSELTTCKINHLSATIESGHLHEMPSLPANLEVICISRYIVQIQMFSNKTRCKLPQMLLGQAVNTGASRVRWKVGLIIVADCNKLMEFFVNSKSAISDLIGHV